MGPLLQGLLDSLIRDRSIAAALSLVDYLEDSGDRGRAAYLSSLIGALAVQIEEFSFQPELVSPATIEAEWSEFARSVRELFWTQTASHDVKTRIQRVLTTARVAYIEERNRRADT